MPDRVRQCVAMCCSVVQCVTVCCSVLQCVAVCCSGEHAYHRMLDFAISTKESYISAKEPCISAYLILIPYPHMGCVYLLTYVFVRTASQSDAVRCSAMQCDAMRGSDLQ